MSAGEWVRFAHQQPAVGDVIQLQFCDAFGTYEAGPDARFFLHDNGLVYRVEPAQLINQKVIWAWRPAQ